MADPEDQTGDGKPKKPCDHEDCTSSLDDRVAGRLFTVIGLTSHRRFTHGIGLSGHIRLEGQDREELRVAPAKVGQAKGAAGESAPTNTRAASTGSAKMDPKQQDEGALAATVAEVSRKVDGLVGLKAELEQLKADKAHVVGLCDSGECSVCKGQAQAIHQHGRSTMSQDLAAAMAWKGLDADGVVDAYEEWEKAGKPDPTEGAPTAQEPELVILES
ncbi:MAG: hypothetical protein IH868_02540 [Chloroflexi bacterium]|nr:hypothetical protein [Chloroflexota bacterium]